MTAKILKSKIGSGFDAAAATHAKEMRDWRAHMARVEEDAKNNVEPAKRHVPYPKPMTNPLVASAVNENDEVDYSVVDDTPPAPPAPTPAQVLRSKKDALIHRVLVAEQKKISETVPFGKREFFAIRHSDILKADAGMIATISPPLKTTIQKITGLVTGADDAPFDTKAEIEKRRSPEDTAFLAEHADRVAKIDAIHRASAKFCSDIEDLTADTVDAWKMPDFPK